jgi:hypothetical protein
MSGCGDLCTAQECRILGQRIDQLWDYIHYLEDRLGALEQAHELLEASFDSHVNQDIPEAHNYEPQVDIPVLGLSRIELKIPISIRDPIIFIPQDLHANYQLKFQKAEWIDSLTLTIYEDSMGLNTGTDSIIFPNTKASGSTATAVAVTTTSAVLLAANVNRKSYLIENNSNQPLFIDFAATVSVPAHAVKIPAVTTGGIISFYEEDTYTGVISGIAAAAGAGSWNIREFV